MSQENKEATSEVAGRGTESQQVTRQDKKFNEQGRSPIDELPDHLLSNMFEYLEIKDVKQAQQVSKRFKSAVEHLPPYPSRSQLLKESATAIRYVNDLRRIFSSNALNRRLEIDGHIGRAPFRLLSDMKRQLIVIRQIRLDQTVVREIRSNFTQLRRDSLELTELIEEEMTLPNYNPSSDFLYRTIVACLVCAGILYVTAIAVAEFRQISAFASFGGIFILIFLSCDIYLRRQIQKNPQRLQTAARTLDELGEVLTALERSIQAVERAVSARSTQTPLRTESEPVSSLSTQVEQLHSRQENTAQATNNTIGFFGTPARVPAAESKENKTTERAAEVEIEIDATTPLLPKGPQ